MQRVHLDLEWTLFCPTEARRLVELVGMEFYEEYERLEMAGRGRSSMRARDLWKEIILSQIESGGPFILFKDSINGSSTPRRTA